MTRRSGIGYSLVKQEQITIVLFDPYKDLMVRGVVVQVDRQLRRIKFQSEVDYSWIKIDDVIRVIT
ncbi:YolD-like family protein [Paenibacillus sp. FSL R10-2199]|uniref:YolD-like family protein n=1 Tax=Paenibacillus sp. FSL R10-2199 TaxID=2975348 RepID=UPI0030F61BA7